MITFLALRFASPSPASEYVRFTELKKEIRATWKGDTVAYGPSTTRQAVNLVEKKDMIQRLVPTNKNCP